MNEELLNEIVRCRSLPTIPAVAMKILQLAQQADVEINDIARVARSDPALASKILKTVNSSFYGRSRPISTIPQAIVVLGIQSVKTLALGFSLVGNIRKARPDGFDPVSYWRRSVYAAVAAKTLGERIALPQAEEAFLAALLQDIGMLAMYTAMGNRYGEVCREITDHGLLSRREDARLGLNHAQVSQKLAEAWSLPPLLCVPIACHHDPQSAPEDLRSITSVVHVAGLCANVFILSDPAEAIIAVREACQRLLGLDSETLDASLHTVGQAVAETADLFEVKIGRHVDYQSILAQANQALLDLSLESQLQARSLESRNQQLQEDASTDVLTGLANRRRLDDFLAEEFRRAKLFLRPLAVLFVDVDHFKGVNELLGHSGGDEALKALARVLRGACRTVDMVGRYGGEEFVCVLTETELLPAARLADAIRIAVADEPIEYQGRRIPLTISIGVAGMEGGQFYTAPQHLLDCADRAVYAAKRDGRNVVRIYNAAAVARRS